MNTMNQTNESTFRYKNATQQINGDEWTVTAFTGTKGIDLGIQLLSLLGDSIFELLTKQDKTIDDNELKSAFKPLFANLKEHNVSQFIKELLSNTLKNGKAINFDIDFSANYKTLMQVLAFIIKTNYADFFG